MFEHLKAYKEWHGTTKVPCGPDTNLNKLGVWVATQRFNLKCDDERIKSSKTATKQIRKLESLNFEWVIQDNVSTWDERLKQLRRFCKAHGH